MDWQSAPPMPGGLLTRDTPGIGCAATTAEYRELPDMDILLAITLVSLVVFVAAATGRLLAGSDDPAPRLTVADIQARLAGEPPRSYVPISRGR
ncbi:hypothetical protein CRH09_30285 [Nocardia terpenica]|uniref:Uncharacterized protein n=1 Tax=Nocardia terpenica TaxID=455432 RepID=A0A291RRD5_9NOCA|nr:hypothetical protein CRH09_30285 [Nocardia terpenica]